MMKKIFSVLLTALLFSLLCITSFAQSTSPLIVDGADVLSETEEQALLTTLEAIRADHDFDVVILTVESLNGEWPEVYADDYYDYNGYSYDGVLLLVCPESGDGHISTSGYGITAITDAGIEVITDDISSDLSWDNYYSAFETYANYCDEFVDRALEGDPFDYDDIPKEPFSIAKSIILSLIIGFAFALVIVLVMKSQLKSVAFKENASEYVKRGSMNLTHSRDLYLYSRVTRTPKPKDNGSGTHRSSSGRSHGGGSFKF